MGKDEETEREGREAGKGTRVTFFRITYGPVPTTLLPNKSNN